MNITSCMNKALERHLIAIFWCAATLLTCITILTVCELAGWIEYETFEVWPLIMAGMSFGKNYERHRT